MTDSAKPTVLIAGGGVAGLTAALAFAHKGFSVCLFDKAVEFSEVGAGLQLAPNATRLLQRLGVMEKLALSAVTPKALLLLDGKSAKTLTSMSLDAATHRWGAPYVVCHRADLQSALLSACQENPDITIRLGCEAVQFQEHENSISVSIRDGNKEAKIEGALLLGCDGVWSKLRHPLKAPEFSGHIAWRLSVDKAALPQSFSKAINQQTAVSAWLGADRHFIAYPVKAGSAYNFVAITRGQVSDKSWDKVGDHQKLITEYQNWHPAIRDIIAQNIQWTYWPLFQMAEPHFVISNRFVLLGDASHAVTPFAAQGAAMAIEDAFSLAAHLSPDQKQWPLALKTYNATRLKRIEAVAKRGAFNKFVYNASGPIALARNLVFKLRSPESLLSDLDWLYAYKADQLFE
ncbi:FAD-dependent monooxygenase [Paenochrobactrum sp. BZR 588]|uniref:FAD-dependent monooxygenase n=1 Tax=unclassified Paenochrobactrum TaxID=2639760 RepID=UPI003851905C